MLNEWLLSLARFLDAQNWSTQIHESIYLYAWIETTHVLTLMVFLGMLFVIDLRMLGLAFSNVRASTIAERLDKPMMIGLVLMVITGVFALLRHSGANDAKPLVSHEGGADCFRRRQCFCVPRAHAGLGEHVGYRPHTTEAYTHRGSRLNTAMGWGSGYRAHHCLRLV